MRIKGAVGLSSGFLGGEKTTESRCTTLQLPNITPKAGTAKMQPYRMRREVQRCGAPQKSEKSPAGWDQHVCKHRLFVCLAEG